MNSPLAKNNAFGIGSPSWNLPFPAGSFTAAEVLAYFPHWLKSIDVIDRFITNGGKSSTIAATINEFRHLPGEGDNLFRPNSVQIMMSFAMRRAGYKDWIVRSHSKFQRFNPDLTELDLNVQGFRTPRETHPKSAPVGRDPDRMAHNKEAAPVEFKTLALHVKIHPAGSDALDLARCVQYAVAYPEETWYFPTDFDDMVNMLGGPATITHSHLDRQIFARRASFVFPSPIKSTPGSKSKATPKSKHTGSNQVMALSHRLTGRTTVPATGSPLKQMTKANEAVEIGGRRKSGRLAGKASMNLPEYDSDGMDSSESPYSEYSTPTKKRKSSRSTTTRGTASNDSDFVQDGSDPDDEIPEAEVVSDEEPISPINAARSRAAARKARQSIRSISTETQRKIESFEQKHALSPQKPQVPPSPLVHTLEYRPEMMTLARNFSRSTPVFIQPPVLSANRLRVDAFSLPLYAAEGCTSVAEMWDSALSSTRFNGPRRSPPFRELHRLTDPPANDVSDWAENIRWAKEQYSRYGSETWTEYDYHLELITEHRMMTWASEEAIRGGY